MEYEKKPILIKGEEYIERFPGKKFAPPKDEMPSYESVKLQLLSNIDSTLKAIESAQPEHILDNFIVTTRMNIKYSAKSYHPKSIINKIGAEEVGTRKWTKKVASKRSKNKEEVKIGKEIFLKVNKSILNEFKNILRNEDQLTQTLQNEIRKLDGIYLDSHQDLIHNFSHDWAVGAVEFVMHPYNEETPEVIKLFKDLIENDNEGFNIKYKTYSSGITFICARLDRQTLENVLKYNPIRTAHPLKIKQLPTTRHLSSSTPLPSPPEEVYASSVKVGVFDGGINQNHPYLKDYATEHNLVPTDKDDDSISHGTGVVGAILYGTLSKFGRNTILPTPVVNVESFRVLPLSNNNDIDLYEIIDAIEAIVPSRNDISIYNLSLGPAGPIEDDYISRFTYAIDELSKTGDKLFTVAVGNDGDLPYEELCRIQAPSDSVNALAVGAYSRDELGSLNRAEYSSYGDGREGCKVKPDILDFGGCDRAPFQLISSDEKNREYSAGTSFAAPLVAAKAAEITARLSTANPLLSRALIVHTADHPNGHSDKFCGHGISPDQIDDLLFCKNNVVTTVYRSKMAPKRSVKLNIPILNDLDWNGRVNVSWTIAVATATDPKNSEDYTLSAIEDTFYPHSHKYKMTKEKKNVVVNINTESDRIYELQNDGWSLASNPASKPGKKYLTEEERKRILSGIQY